MSTRASEYRNLSVANGGVARTVKGIEARKRIDRELHNIVVQTPVPKTQQDFIHDLRRGRRRVYGSLLRYIEIAVSQGVPRNVLLRIPQFLSWFIMDLCDAHEGTAARDGIASDDGRAA